METRIFNDVKLSTQLTFAYDSGAFPQFPALGTVVIKDQTLYAYVKVNGLETWYPFAAQSKHQIYTTETPALEWVITHNLGSVNAWIQVQDDAGRIVQPQVTVFNENTVKLNFTVATAGTALLVVTDVVNTPAATANSVTIGDTVIDSTGVKINGAYVLTSVDLADDIASGVAVETTARVAADSTVQTNFSSKVNQPLLTTSTPTFNGVFYTKGTRGKSTALGTVNGNVSIDLASADIFTLTANGNITFSFANTPPAGNTQFVIIRGTNLGNYTIQFPAGTKYVTGSVGFTTSGSDVLAVYYDPIFAAYVVGVANDIK